MARKPPLVLIGADASDLAVVKVDHCAGSCRFRRFDQLQIGEPVIAMAARAISKTPPWVVSAWAVRDVESGSR
jgi:hypothetical protein